MQERHEQILQCLKRTHRMKVQEMVRLFHVSDMTIRRDLEALEQQGLLRRIHGGAELVTARSIEPAVSTRLQIHKQEKEAIVREALRFIEGDETVLLDAGSTTYLLSQQLPVDSDLKVVTNSLDIAGETMHRGINTIMLGGVLLPSTSSGVGLLTQESLRQLSMEKSFIGTSGLTLENGFSNDNLFEVEVKKQMIYVSREVTVLADSSKWGRKALGVFAALEDVARVITDWNAPESMVQTLRELGIEVIVAEGKSFSKSRI